MKFTADDIRLLRSLGIDPETANDDVLAVAKQIAKHPAPGQVKVNPQAAKLQLIKLALNKLLDAEKES